jgi:lambda family phage minor tail protein L
MTDIIASSQKLDTDASEFIELFSIEYAAGSHAYFYNGGFEATDSSTKVRFRDAVGGTVREYTPIPIDIEGMKFEMEGASVRPTLTIANISTIFSTSIGDMNFEELIGQRVTKRTTLRKYLYDQNTTNPPIEYPVQSYVIDRIVSKNILQVVFELASPFDLQGTSLPSRQIIGGGCPWKYQGAALSLAENAKKGGCSWEPDGKITTYVGTATDYNIYVNKADEFIVPNAIVQASTSSPSISSFYSYNAGNSLTRVNSNGSKTASQAKIYQVMTPITGLGATPTNTNSEVVRRFRPYSASDTYYAYTDTDFNEYVLYNNVIWQVKNVTQTGGSHITTPESGSYWQRGDSCGKKLTSCAKRFHSTGTSSTISGVTTKHVKANALRDYITLPFGGFPGSRRFK